MVHETFLFNSQKPDGKNLVLQLWPKMLLTNHTAGFFDREYLWKESIDVLVFLQGACDQGKVASKTTFLGTAS